MILDFGLKRLSLSFQMTGKYADTDFIRFALVL